MISVLLRPLLRPPEWERDRSQSALVCLESPTRGGVRPSVKAEAAKRGRDSASLYGLRPVRFNAVSSKRAQTSLLRI
jgi:hypothetical protein